MRTTGKNCSAVIASYVRRRITHRWNIPSKELFGCFFLSGGKQRGEEERGKEGGRRREKEGGDEEKERGGTGGGRGRRGGGMERGMEWGMERRRRRRRKRRERSFFHCFNLRPKLWRSPQWDTVQHGNKDIM